MKHPSIENLALYGGGELPWWTRLTMRRHVHACPQCQEEFALFRETAEAVREETAEMPAGVQWDRLAAEMRANVRVGIAASDTRHRSAVEFLAGGQVLNDQIGFHGVSPGNVGMG